MKYIEKPRIPKESIKRCAKITAAVLIVGVILTFLRIDIGKFVIMAGVILPVLFCLINRHPKERVPDFVGRMGLIRYSSTFEPFYIDFRNQKWCYGYPDMVGVCGTFCELKSVTIIDTATEGGKEVSIGVEITMTDGEKLMVDFIQDDVGTPCKEYSEARELAEKFKTTLQSIIADPNQWKEKTYTYAELIELTEKFQAEFRNLKKTCTTANLQYEAKRLYKKYHISPSISEPLYMPYKFSDVLVVTDVVKDFYRENTLYSSKSKMQYIIKYETPNMYFLTLKEQIRGISYDTPPPSLKKGEKRFAEGRIYAYHDDAANTLHFIITR
ncbi:MAG: hypothetical protein ACI4J8_10490 [Oscillospiraceae bacterium]